MQIENKDYCVVGISERTDVPVEVMNELKKLGISTKTQVKDKLLHLIQKYPGVPVLRNQLVTWYLRKEMNEKAGIINDELLALFPNYIFARNLKIVFLLDKNDFNGALELLGKDLDIGAVYPDRKIFYLDEYYSYNSTVIHYLVSNYWFTEAEAKIKQLAEMGIEGPEIEILYEVLNNRKNEKRLKLLSNNEEAIERTECTLPQKEITIQPSANKYEFLYHDDLWDIDQDLLKLAIEEDKEGLIKELKHIIISAIEGYEYCVQTGFNSQAVLHATLILPYLDDENTFIDVLQLSRQTSDFDDYWFGDWFETLVIPYFKRFTPAKLNQLKDIILESPGVTTAKNGLAELLPQFVVFTPEARNKVIHAIKEILEYFIAHHDDSQLFDSEVLGFIVGAAVELHATELTDIISEMYDNGWVASYVMGDIEDVLVEMNSDRELKKQTTYNDIFAHLDDLEIIPSLDNNINKFTDEQIFDLYDDGTQIKPENETHINDLTPPERLGYAPTQTISTVPKPTNTIPKPINIFANAAKNSPCPCGSGKKYKRCHGM